MAGISGLGAGAHLRSPHPSFEASALPLPGVVPEKVSGHSPAPYSLAALFENGLSTNPHFNASLDWCKRVAHQGHSEAQRYLGIFYAIGQGVSRNYAVAENWLQKASDNNDMAALYCRAILRNLGLVRESKRDEAREFELRAKNRSPEERRVCDAFEAILMADLSSPSSASSPKSDEDVTPALAKPLCGEGLLPNLRVAYGKGRLKRSASLPMGLAQARLNLRSSPSLEEQEVRIVSSVPIVGTHEDPLHANATAGKSASQFELAIKLDIEAAKKQNKHNDELKRLTRYWCEKAAKQGHLEACTLLGTWYLEGRNGSQDFVKASAWLRIAAEAQHAYAQYLLAKLFESGEGVKKDYEEAFRWCQAAAIQGETQAQRDLGIWYAMGQGVTRHFKRAYAWLNLAAGKRDEGAVYCCAVLLNHGLGVKKDVAQAAGFFKISAKNCEGTEFEQFARMMETIANQGSRCVIL